MRYRIKIPFQIRIVDGLIARLQMRPNFLQSIMGRSFVAESITAFQKVRLEYRFQDQERGHLDYPIPYRRNAQRPQFPIGFLNPYATYGLRTVSFLLQRLLDLVQ